MRRAAAALSLVAVVAALAAGCAGLGLGDEAKVIPPEQRHPAPAFTVPDLDGAGEVSLADYRGTPVVLNFWASWCDPCQQETPALVAFSKERRDVQVVGLAVNDRGSKSRAFARKYGVHYPLGVDGDGDTIAKYGANGLPVTVFIDADGRIAQTSFGALTQQQFEGYADKIGA
ncbi:MAG TPA: TlpA disulfide reductase family protein [Miltoncostaeaceae bacterium]|nr:TlpA disulfide reductase family protein [Miltoncostaeaceae bacterium]